MVAPVLIARRDVCDAASGKCRWPFADQRPGLPMGSEPFAKGAAVHPFHLDAVAISGEGTPIQHLTDPRMLKRGADFVFSSEHALVDRVVPERGFERFVHDDTVVPMPFEQDAMTVFGLMDDFRRDIIRRLKRTDWDKKTGSLNHVDCFCKSNVFFVKLYAMSGRLSYLSSFCALAAVLSCSDRPAEAPSRRFSGPFDDTVYCFNQRSVVYKDGFAGMIDDAGTVILSPEWDSVEFLDDEIALLKRSESYYLSTRDGRIFTEAASAADLDANYQERWAETQDADIRKWDIVLDRLDELCTQCLRLGEKQPDKAAEAAYASFSAALTAASGQMSPLQQERFERIVLRFNTFSGR